MSPFSYFSSQVVEAALTTALTDRPYSKPLAVYAENSRNLQVMGVAGAGTTGAATTGPFGGGGGGGLGADVSDEALPVGEEEEDGLAEVDFRDQYDDFA